MSGRALRGVAVASVCVIGAACAVTVGASTSVARSSSRQEGSGKDVKRGGRSKAEGRDLFFQGPNKVEKGSKLKIINKTSSRASSARTRSRWSRRTACRTPSRRSRSARTWKLAVCVNVSEVAHKVGPPQRPTFEVKSKPKVEVGKKGWDKVVRQDSEGRWPRRKPRSAHNTRKVSAERMARRSTTSAWFTPSCRGRSRSSSGSGLPARRRELAPDAPAAACGRRRRRGRRSHFPRRCAASGPARRRQQRRRLDSPRVPADPARDRRPRFRLPARGGGDRRSCRGADADVDLRRDFPGPDDPPARGRADPGHLRHQLPREGGRAHRAPARRAQPLRRRRPARRADRTQPRRSTATSRPPSRRATPATTC